MIKLTRPKELKARPCFAQYTCSPLSALRSSRRKARDAQLQHLMGSGRACCRECLRLLAAVLLPLLSPFWVRHIVEYVYIDRTLGPQQRQ